MNTLNNRVIGNQNHGEAHNAAAPAAGFTLIELLVVISIIGVLAGLTVGLSTVTSHKKKINRTKTQLNELTLAIERYKNTFGSYPPDSGRKSEGHIVSNGTWVKNTALNPLFYELTGTIAHRGAASISYASAQSGGGRVSSEDCQRFFGRSGFQNNAPDPDKTKTYIELKAEEFAPISAESAGGVNLLLAPVKWPRNAIEDLETYQPVRSENKNLRILNPWQYRSGNDDWQPYKQYNSKSFDLWADIPVGNKLYRVSNWMKSEELLNK